MKFRLLPLALIPGVLLAGDLFSFKPTLLHPEDGPGIVPAIRIKSDARKEREFGRADRYVFAEYDLASTWATKEEANDEKTSLDLRSGIEWRFDSVARPVRRFPGSVSTPNESGAGQSAMGLRWGSISSELAGAFEGDQSMDNRQWAYGLRVNYTPAYDRAESQWWLPYVWADYRRISEMGSELADRLGVPEQDYWRFGCQVFWQVTPADFGIGGGNLKIVPGIQYYRSTDLAVALGDLADAWQYSLALDYAVPVSSAWGKKVSAVRVQIASGRVPPAQQSRTTVSLALTVRWGELLK